MKSFVFFFYLLFSLLGIINLSACKRAQDEATSSKIQIRIPTLQEQSSAIKSSAVSSTVNYNLLCFAINVTGPDIPVTTGASTCNVERGIFEGSVAPGQSLTVMVPMGSSRNFEVYGFLRNNTSEACPTAFGSNWNWPLQKVYLLGQTNGVDISTPESSVSIGFSIPQSEQNIITQKGWSSTCRTAVTEDKSVGRIQTATSAPLSGSQFKIYSRVNTKNELQTLEGSQFQIHNWSAEFD